MNIIRDIKDENYHGSVKDVKNEYTKQKKLFQHTQMVTLKPRMGFQCYFFPKSNNLEKGLDKKKVVDI